MSALFNVINPVEGVKVTGGYGGYIVGDHGDRYLDWYMDNGVTPLGYSPRAWAARLPSHIPQGYRLDLREEVAKQLATAVGLDSVYFAMSGTDAVETAIKAARLYQYKRHRSEHKFGIISLDGQYHGRTGFSMAATRGPLYHKLGFGPMPSGFGVARMVDDVPMLDHVDWDGDDYSVDNVAAVILAPVQGSNVIRMYSPGFHQYVREWCNRHGALLIHDDVQAGSGRCGTVASWQRADVAVRPDIVCLGKGLAAGEPLAATVATQEVADAFTPGTHFYTAGGSTTYSLQSCRAMLDWLLQNPNAAEQLGSRLTQELKAMPGMRTAWNVGAMVAAVPDWKDVDHPDKPDFDAFQLFKVARKHGLLLLNFRAKNELKIMPRLDSPEVEIQEGLRALRATLVELMA